MNSNDHNKILAIGLGVFAIIYAFTFLLLMLTTAGMFVALGISFASETGDGNHAGIGIAGAVFTIIFYGLLGSIFVLPTALACWKLLKRKAGARVWAIIASILVAPVMPFGTVLAIYGLWFLFSPEGRQFPSPEAGTP